MDIQSSLASRVYAGARAATAPDPAKAETAAAQYLGDFAATLDRGEETARAAMIGKADPHALVEALASSQMAVETVVTLRDKVVEAYQEILRMPV